MVNLFPQGSILDPILYNTFTPDLPDLPPGCQKSLFADDTSISVKGKSLRVIISRLQKSLDIFNSYFKNWKITSKASKTQLIIFQGLNFLNQRVTTLLK